jgi:DNA-binding NarL/FixJ family response regulator
VKISVLTMHKDVEFLSQAISAGADGYLLNEDTEAEVFSAIKAMRAGRTYVSQLLSEGVAEIAAASQEQAQGAEQAKKAVRQMDKVVHQNAPTPSSPPPQRGSFQHMRKPRRKS